MELFKNISSATASRDLKDGVESNVLAKIGKANQTRYILKNGGLSTWIDEIAWNLKFETSLVLTSGAIDL